MSADGASALFPVFLKLEGRDVLLVGGGPVAESKLAGLLAAGALVKVVAPEVRPGILASPARVLRRAFRANDLDGAWLVVATAPPEVNRAVVVAAEARGVFVNAVDDPAHASAYTGGVLRRGGVTIAVSTEGRAPALAGLLREALEAIVPEDIAAWVAAGAALRAEQKKIGVPMGQRRPLLLRALNRIYSERLLEATDEARPQPTEPLRPKTQRGREPRTAALRLDMGFVSLVGAGPGDPELLTLRAARALAAADIVFYDALVTRETLDFAPRAQCFSVGKRAGRASMDQDAINRLLVRSARRGKRVVRLKGGDPFVFGRGGEEALALVAAGVPFEVIPGVSNAVAAPALSGIPVTHRGLASAFAVVSGHAESAWRPVVEGLTPGSATLVVLMGLSARETLAAALQARGWAAATPAAILWAAGTAAATRWVGTLGSLALAEAPSGAEGAPGTIVVGAVVALSATIGRQEREETDQDVRPAPSPAAAEGGHHARPR